MSIALLGLACFLTWFSHIHKNILLAMCCSLTWFGLAFWIFFGTAPLFDMAEQHSKILVWVFIMMTFIPWLFQMDVEIQNESNGRKWREWGSKPEPKKRSYTEYLRKRWRR